MGKLRDNVEAGGFARFVSLPKSEFQFKLPRGVGLGALDMVWFSPALLYIYSPFNDNVLAAHQDAHGDPQLGYCRFKRPIFRGMVCAGNTDWDHVLWGVRTDAWDAFSMQILGTVYAGRNHMVKYGLNRVVVADPLLMDAGCLLTAQSGLPVYVFGVDATFGRMYVPETLSVGDAPPAVIKTAPTPAMRSLLSTVLTGGNLLARPDDTGTDTDNVHNGEDL